MAWTYFGETHYNTLFNLWFKLKLVILHELNTCRKVNYWWVQSLGMLHASKIIQKNKYRNLMFGRNLLKIVCFPFCWEYIKNWSFPVQYFPSKSGILPDTEQQLNSGCNSTCFQVLKRRLRVCCSCRLASLNRSDRFSCLK